MKTTTTASLLTSAESRMAVVSYKPKYMYVHEVQVNRLVKLAKE